MPRHYETYVKISQSPTVSLETSPDSTNLLIEASPANLHRIVRKINLFVCILVNQTMIVIAVAYDLVGTRD